MLFLLNAIKQTQAMRQRKLPKTKTESDPPIDAMKLPNAGTMSARMPTVATLIPE